jgi:NitT/TauT family transport system substrate-binding protein
MGGGGRDETALVMAGPRMLYFSQAKSFPREKHMRSLKLVLAAAAAVLVTSAARAEPVKIRGAWVAPVSNWASIVAEKKDLAKHWGKSYTFEAIRFAGTPPMMTALAAGELEVANLAYSTFPLAVQNANMDDLRIVADEFQDGVDGYATNEWAVLKDSPIKKVEDLKGKVIATNAAGSPVDIAARAMLKKHGLEANRDYTIIEAPFPTMKAMLKDKKADLAPYVLPFNFDPELQQIARPLFSSKDAIGVSQFIIWAMRKSFIDKNRAAVVDFMEDMLTIERWYMDPKNHKEVTEIAGKMMKAPPARFDWLFTKKDYYRNPNMLPDLKALQSNIDTTHELGFIKAKLDVSKYADLSLVQEAAKRLK